MKKYDIDTEARVDRGVEYFKEGYNCSQSVAMTYADVYGIDPNQMALLAASFGGGIGRMRMTCGAATGMALLAGLECGTNDPKDAQAKAHNYAVTQQLINTFKDVNGSFTCAELLGIKKDTRLTPVPDQRNAEYYAKRPCARMVGTACRIYADYLNSLDKQS